MIKNPVNIHSSDTIRLLKKRLQLVPPRKKMNWLTRYLKEISDGGIIWAVKLFKKNPPWNVDCALEGSINANRNPPMKKLKKRIKEYFDGLTLSTNKLTFILFLIDWVFQEGFCMFWPSGDANSHDARFLFCYFLGLIH